MKTNRDPPSVKRRILVVEDEAIIAMDIAMQLCELGYELEGHATTGERAIELAGLLRPDLVLMDIHLASAMDGITAAQAIRTKFDLPCVFLSAFATGSYHSKSSLTEPVGYIAKPFEEYELRDAIEAAFDQ